MEVFVMRWMELESVIQSEVNQKDNVHPNVHNHYLQ